MIPRRTCTSARRTQISTLGVTTGEPSGWRSLIPTEEWAICRAAGYGRASRWGSRPALIIVDATYRFVGLRAPQAESMKVYPASTGSRAWDALASGRVLLDEARARGHLVAYTVRDESPAVQAGQPRREKHGPAFAEPDEAAQVVELLAPLTSEAVIPKAKPSAFHGTPLLSLLVYHQIDTLVVVGGVTSGCVRATVVDAFSLGYRVAIPEDAVFDRSELLHAVSLFDMEQKYGDVCPSTRVAAYLRDPANGAARE